MPYSQPQQMPEDMDDLDQMVAKAYTEGVDTGRERGKTDAIQAFKEFFEREFKNSKGRRRLADPDDPKTAAILEVWEKFNAKFGDGIL